jgi:acetyltransferase-like isoleucine patch superfamily enzyme
MCHPKHKSSHGNGRALLSEIAQLGSGVVIEDGVLIFHPESIEIGDHVYIGHQTILKGYYKNKMIIGEGSWIGQQCFLHSGGGLRIGRNVGIGPGVKIITSHHSGEELAKPILHGQIKFAEVVIEDNCDVGAGAIILPGVKIGRGAQVGAGAVVTRDVPPNAVVAGVPSKLLRMRK